MLSGRCSGKYFFAVSSGGLWYDEGMTEQNKRKELNHFIIDGMVGGNQDWFTDPMMRLGGCAAETACDSSIYFALHLGMTGLYPGDPEHLSRKDYLEFSKIMKPYLKPRFGGIDRLDIYEEGYGKYLQDQGEDRITMTDLSGNAPAAEAWEVLQEQIRKEIPVPCLLLNHNDPEIRKEYQWHWFLLNAFDETGEKRLVRTVTYGEYAWVDFQRLWNTGYSHKGGLILYHIAEH